MSVATSHVGVALREEALGSDTLKVGRCQRVLLPLRWVCGNLLAGGGVHQDLELVHGLGYQRSTVYV
jgi:hypothetical protein